MRLDEPDQLGELGNRAGQPIDIVEDDYVDPSGFDMV